MKELAVLTAYAFICEDREFSRNDAIPKIFVRE